MLSPKISQAKALVRFSGSEAARKAAGSEIRYRIAKCSQKFVCVLPAVCTPSKTHDSGSPRIAFVIESFIRNKNILLGQFPGTCGLPDVDVVSSAAHSGNILHLGTELAA